MYVALCSDALAALLAAGSCASPLALIPGVLALGMFLFASGLGDLAYLKAYEVDPHTLGMIKYIILHEVRNGANNPCLLRMRSRVQRRDEGVTTCVDMELDRLVFETSSMFLFVQAVVRSLIKFSI